MRWLGCVARLAPDRPPTKAIRVDWRGDYIREDACREINLDILSRGYTRGLLMRTAG